MPSAYPSAKDTFPNPLPNTLENAPGFELDLVVGNLGDALEALETKLGIGAAIAAANQVLRATGVGVTSFGQIQTLDLVANAITQRAASGTFTGTRTAATYADVDSTNGKVTLTMTGGDLLVWMVGSCSNTVSGVAQHVALKLDADANAGIMPVYSLPGAATFPLAFVTMTMYAAPAAGSHSIVARHINDSASGTMTTSAQLFALEIKR